MFAIPWAFLIVLLVRQRAKDGFFILPPPGIIVAPSSTAKLPAASCRLAGSPARRNGPHRTVRRDAPLVVTIGRQFSGHQRYALSRLARQGPAVTLVSMHRPGLRHNTHESPVDATSPRTTT
ncbi:hypothetical protein [Aromatoleum bremense]|uniref:hypothetical protein n=1 Tax=Aromatoleum bremense TaxID=76115 RepID=UPI00145F457F|nr:hypothetical protein [Aromatoleum bremense]